MDEAILRVHILDFNLEHDRCVRVFMFRAITQDMPLRSSSPQLVIVASLDDLENFVENWNEIAASKVVQNTQALT